MASNQSPNPIVQFFSKNPTYKAAAVIGLASGLACLGFYFVYNRVYATVKDSRSDLHILREEILKEL